MVGRRQEDQELQLAAAARAERSFWKHAPARLETIAILITALVGVIGYLGYHISTPLEARVTKLEEREDLDSYILCMMARRTDPISLPPDCAPIEAAYARRGNAPPDK